MSTAIVLFRRDLRLADNPALVEACATYERILPIYIHTEHEDAWGIGAASRWWLHHSLEALQKRLRERGAHLHLQQGQSIEVLPSVILQSGASAVYWNRRYEPSLIAQDRLLKSALQELGIAVHTFAANLWIEPWRLQTKRAEPYRVFTPYWRALRPMLKPTSPLKEPKNINGAEFPSKLTLSALKLLPKKRWDAGLAQAWQPGEIGAQEALELFCDDALIDYAFARDLPGRCGTSRLSAHLHFGELSPRQIHCAIHARAQQMDATKRPDIEPYLRELGWREFAHHLLYHFPQTPTQSFNLKFDQFPWAPLDNHACERWRRGQTGIPLVDAGMRELWHTGWMHNRVRMVVASFLTKNLRQHWSVGAQWFWDTLVDADLANNTLGWQWVAGCGADAAPYFRVFNPVTQAYKFDPNATYLRRWLPELANEPTELLHEPWKDSDVMRRTGYPEPIVDIKESRENAIAAYQAWRALNVM